MTFAIAGCTLAFYSVRTKQKQPDPCQRNYYRSDAGECIFGPPKASSAEDPVPERKTTAPQSTTKTAPQSPQRGAQDDPLNLFGPENKPLDECLSKANPADPTGLYDETPQQAAKRADCIKKFGKQ
jgi:hypothetical protein